MAERGSVALPIFKVISQRVCCSSASLIRTDGVLARRPVAPSWSWIPCALGAGCGPVGARTARRPPLQPAEGTSLKSYLAVYQGLFRLRPSGALPGACCGKSTIRLLRTPNTASESR